MGLNLSDLREAIGNDAIVNDLSDDDVVVAFIGTDKGEDLMNVKGYVEGDPERLSTLLAHCMTENERFCGVVVNALRLYHLHNMDISE